MDVTDIEKRFADHRAKAFVTCEETCMCWDIEKLLFLLETTRLTPVAAELAIRRCPECRAMLEEKSVYCDRCGADTPRR